MSQHRLQQGLFRVDPLKPAVSKKQCGNQFAIKLKVILLLKLHCRLLNLGDNIVTSQKYAMKLN